MLCSIFSIQLSENLCCLDAPGFTFRRLEHGKGRYVCLRSTPMLTIRIWKLCDLNFGNMQFTLANFLNRNMIVPLVSAKVRVMHIFLKLDVVTLISLWIRKS